MRIGIVCRWLDRNQGVAGSHLRSLLDHLGHETSILDRPARNAGERLPSIELADLSNRPGITPASRHDIPLREYLSWARDHFLEAVFFDRNFQFEEIAALRATGVKTIGRFDWEGFTKRDVRGAMKAFDAIYSLTRCEQARYRELGIRSPLLRWGCHPELAALSPRRSRKTITFFYPGGYRTHRQPTREVIRAFTRVPSLDIRLLIKVQRLYRHEDLIGDLGTRDPRIEVVAADLPAPAYHDLFASCHVCLAPSRWEGYGQHLYEAIAFGLPIITNDNPPMNELVTDRYNGLLVKSHPCGCARSGIPAFDPDVDDLHRAIAILSDRSLLEELSANARRLRELMSWEDAAEDFRKLLESLESPRAAAIPALARPENAAAGPGSRF